MASSKARESWRARGDAVLSTDTSTALRYPYRIGRYELLAKIASGGMATMFLGRARGARGFERVVAIKRLHPRFEHDSYVVGMFLEEARVAARIRHPNVVSTLDVDDTDGLVLVMEYVEGDQLLGLVRVATDEGVPIPRNIVVRIVLDVLAGLHAAHELTDDEGKPLRIVHRDVSPHNVLVGVDGVSRVTDFGIAKVGDTLVTDQPSRLIGKLAYMAPEQARRERVDRRTDVFAAAIILWEALAGRRLFLTDTEAGTLGAVLLARAPSLEALPGIGAGLAAVVAKALQLDRQDRYETAADFASALEAAALAGVGIAPARSVAEHVRAISGAKIEQERERLRAVSLARVEVNPSPDRQTAHTDITVSLPTVTESYPQASGWRTWGAAVAVTVALGGAVLAGAAVHAGASRLSAGAAHGPSQKFGAPAASSAPLAVAAPTASAVGAAAAPSGSARAPARPTKSPKAPPSVIPSNPYRRK